MTIRELFDFDYAALEAYISKMLKFRLSDFFQYNYNNEEYLKNSFSCSYLIMPGLVVEMYSLVDFYLKMIVSRGEKINTSCSYKDFLQKEKLHRKSDLYKYCRYIDECFGADFCNSELYERIDELRLVRNPFVHGGSHAELREKIKSIKYINLDVFDEKSKTALVTVQDEFFPFYLKYIKLFFDAVLNNMRKIRN